MSPILYLLGFITKSNTQHFFQFFFIYFWGGHEKRISNSSEIWLKVGHFQNTTRGDLALATHHSHPEHTGN